MSWKKPDFEELALCMEVTAYVNAEDELPLPVKGGERHPAAQAAAVSRDIDEQNAE